MPINIGIPDKNLTPPTGILDGAGNLVNVSGTWSRPGGGTGVAVEVWGEIFDDATQAPARPTSNSIRATTITNPYGSAGTWYFDQISGAGADEDKKLVVWLDIETEACYERDPVIFFGQNGNALPAPGQPGPVPVPPVPPR